jgi:hypothetical protein
MNAVSAWMSTVWPVTRNVSSGRGAGAAASAESPRAGFAAAFAAAPFAGASAAPSGVGGALVCCTAVSHV